MSGGSLRWGKAKEHRRRSEARAELAESDLGSSIRSIENANERAWLATILEEEHVTTAMRKQLASAIQWLVMNPARTLACSFRVRFENYEVAIRIAKRRVANGQPAWDRLPTEWKARPWPKAERPAWMNDPSLLPKRPPGRS